MTAPCTSTTWDRLVGCEVRCILPAGHDVYHTDGCGMTWRNGSPRPFSAHDLDIDNSGSRVRRQLQVKPPQPPTEEEIVERTRRDTYKNILAGLGVDYEEDASATTLLLQVNAEVERAVELRDAARAVVEALSEPVAHPRHCDHPGCNSLATRSDRRTGGNICDAHGVFDRLPVSPVDFTYAPAWRVFCALVKP